jgi:hypothetical protein
VSLQEVKGESSDFDGAVEDNLRAMDILEAAYGHNNTSSRVILRNLGVCGEGFGRGIAS